MTYTLGQWGEYIARQHYRWMGFRIVAKNTFNRRGKQMGEIDFVARNHNKLIFVEVKTRSIENGKFGTGAEAVNIYKQQRILKAVKFFLVTHPEYQHLQPQIDVCVIEATLDKILKNVTILSNAVTDLN